MSWFHHDDTISATSLWRMLRLLPGSLGLVARIAWQAKPSAVVAAFTAQAASGLITAFGLLAVTKVLTELFAHGPTPQRVLAALPVLLVVGALYSTRGLADSIVSATTARLIPSVLRRAEHDLAVCLSKVELTAFDTPDFHDSLTRARYRGVDAIDSAISRAVALIGAGIALLATAATITVLHPLLLPALAASVLPEAWSAIRSARLEHLSVMNMIENRRRFQMMIELLADRDSAAEVRAYTAQQLLVGEQDRLSEIMEAEKIRVATQQSTTAFLGRTLAGLGVALAYGLLGWLLYTGATPLAVAGAAVVALRTVRGSMTQAVLAVNRLFEQCLYIGDYHAFLTATTNLTRPPSDTTAPDHPTRIELNDVGFTYPDAATPALDGINLTVEQGQVIALVGENGSGKSTLAKLLTGLYLPTTGSLNWDGIDLATVDGNSIAGQVAIVMQNPTRWPFTARRNVTLGKLDHHDLDDEMLIQAAQQSGAAAVIESLPDGWDSLLTKRFKNGCDLSGGQWQRIGVARALYRDAPILICDEPTAALDARAEAAVYESLRRLQHGRTVFLITHRLASVRHADQIVVLHHGAIIETGTHDQLMAAAGTYAELYNLQAKAYHDNIRHAEVGA